MLDCPLGFLLAIEAPAAASGHSALHQVAGAAEIRMLDISGGRLHAAVDVIVLKVSINRQYIACWRLILVSICTPYTMATTDIAKTDQTDTDHATRHDASGEPIETIPIPPLAHTLHLEPHPEGGWFRQTWAGDAQVTLPNHDQHTDASQTDDNDHDQRQKQKTRPTATLIIFLLPAGDASKWHKVDSDEIWIWNGLGELTLQLGGTGEVPPEEDEGEDESGGKGERVVLGDPRNGEGRQVQGVVKGGRWQRTLPGKEDALFSCVVSPGFSFEDFQT